MLYTFLDIEEIWGALGLLPLLYNNIGDTSERRTDLFIQLSQILSHDLNFAWHFDFDKNFDLDKFDFAHDFHLDWNSEVLHKSARGAGSFFHILSSTYSQSHKSKSF